MLITRFSMLTGRMSSQDLDVTQEQLDDYYLRDRLLQEAFPHLSADHREFIRTGITPEEWEIFAIEQEQEDDDV